MTKKIAGYTAIASGSDPNYHQIDCLWKNDLDPYVAIHRVAISNEYRGMHLASCFHIIKTTLKKHQEGIFMKKKGIGIISLILIIIIAIVAGIKIKQNHDENAVQEIQPVKVSSKTVPTFFFHGWGSSWHAEDTMAQAIKRAGATNTIVRVNVNKKGHARLIGKIKKNAKNPLVEVNFSDNKLTNSQYSGQYANA